MATGKPAATDAVYTGFWTDYDHSRVYGASLTLTNPDARVFMAFLVVLVGFSANRCWKICRFLIHQRLVNPEQQVIFRNSETASSALMSHMELVYDRWSYFWQPGRRKRLASITLVILFIFGHWTAFISLGILTSQVARGSVVKSAVTPTCGTWHAIGNGLNDSQGPSDRQDVYVAGQVSNEALRRNFITGQMQLNDSLNADNYVRNCYNTEARPIFDCSKLKTRSLGHFTESVTCPFDDGFCSTSDGQAFAMDTGNISFSQLGINGRYANSFFVRRRNICSPLVDEPFRYNDNQKTSYLRSLGFDPEVIPTLLFRTGVYAYGPLTDINGDEIPGKNNTVLFATNATSTYSVVSQIYFHPFREIRPRGPYKYGDLNLINVRGDLIHTLEPSSDPVFTFLHNASSLLNSDPIYKFSRPQSTIACIEVAMYCVNSTGRCTEWFEVLSGFSDTRRAYLGEGLKKDEFKELTITGTLVNLLLDQTSIYYSILNRDGAALQASKLLKIGTQYQLYPEQWKFELQYWFSVGLAQLQLNLFTTIQAQPDLDVKQLGNTFDELPILRLVCGRVKFHSSQHTTMSVLGIATVLAVSFFMTVISYLDVIFKRLFMRSRVFGRAMQTWEATENLQLLRAAEKLSSGLQEKGSQHEDMRHEVVDKKVPV
jgi:hypothetical protein